MKIGVSLKINVSMIEKARLFTGQKGQYLDATVFIDVNDLDQYGNSGMITQDVSKEEKAQGVKGPILGNCKVFWNNSAAPQQHGGFQQQAPQQPIGGFQKQQQSPPPQYGFVQQGVGMTNPNNASQFQSAPPNKINPQEPMSVDFDESIPF